MALSRRFSPLRDWTRGRITGRGNGGADLGSQQRAPPRHKTGAALVLEHINTVTIAEANLDAGQRQMRPVPKGWCGNGGRAALRR